MIIKLKRIIWFRISLLEKIFAFHCSRTCKLEESIEESCVSIETL